MPHVELPQAEFKVVMLGDTNAGKTSLVLRFAEGHYRDEGRSSTVGAFFITKRVQTTDGITCKVQIWDTAGQEQFRKMAPMYYSTAAAAIVCYDISSPKSFRVMREWVEELHKNAIAGSIVLAIVATKRDLLEDPSMDVKFVPTSDATELASRVGAMFIDTSARNNENVHKLFQRVSEKVLECRERAFQHGYSEETSIPVTPGSRINDRGKIVKSWTGTTNGEVMSRSDSANSDSIGSDTKTPKKNKPLNGDELVDDLVDDKVSMGMCTVFECSSDKNTSSCIVQ